MNEIYDTKVERKVFPLGEDRTAVGNCKIIEKPRLDRATTCTYFQEAYFQIHL
jgi:hypothetical protein